MLVVVKHKQGGYQGLFSSIKGKVLTLEAICIPLSCWMDVRTDTSDSQQECCPFVWIPKTHLPDSKIASWKEFLEQPCLEQRLDPKLKVFGFGPAAVLRL